MKPFSKVLIAVAIVLAIFGTYQTTPKAHAQFDAGFLD